MLLDIVILPPAKLRQAVAKAMARAAKKIPAKSRIFQVDNKKLLPHMSLFHIRTSKSGLNELEKILPQIIAKYKPTKIRSAGARAVRGFVVLDLSIDPGLKKLNRDVVKKCHVWRTGAMPWFNQGRKPNYIESMKRKRYGTQYNIGKSFHPHLTMAKYKADEDSTRVAPALERLRYSFIADTVAICEVNFWHQATRIIKIFKLKS